MQPRSHLHGLAACEDPCLDQHDTLASRPAQPRFRDYPLPARLLLATLRLQAHSQETPTLDGHVQNCLRRLLDSSADSGRIDSAVATASRIALSRTRSPLQIQRVNAMWVSHDEHALLDAASAHLQGRHRLCAARMQWLMDNEASGEFIEAITTLAQCSAFATLGPHALSRNPGRLIEEREMDGTRHDTVICCSDLAFAEQLVLNSARLWVKCMLQNVNSFAALTRLSQCLGLRRLDTTLHSILQLTAFNATRQFDVRCFCCHELSPDEARLLATMASLASGKLGESVEHMNQWLPADCVQKILGNIATRRIKLLEWHSSLPMRNWDFDSLTQRQVLFDVSHSAHGTHAVH